MKAGNAWLWWESDVSSKECPVVTNAEEYLRRAEECERKSVEANDLEAKRMFKEAAHQWRLMASAAQRHSSEA